MEKAAWKRSFFQRIFSKNFGPVTSLIQIRPISIYDVIWPLVVTHHPNHLTVTTSNMFYFCSFKLKSSVNNVFNAVECSWMMVLGDEWCLSPPIRCTPVLSSRIRLVCVRCSHPRSVTSFHRLDEIHYSVKRNEREIIEGFMNIKVFIFMY